MHIGKYINFKNLTTISISLQIVLILLSLYHLAIIPKHYNSYQKAVGFNWDYKIDYEESPGTLTGCRNPYIIQLLIKNNSVFLIKGEIDYLEDNNDNIIVRRLLLSKNKKDKLFKICKNPSQGIVYREGEKIAYEINDQFKLISRNIEYKNRQNTEYTKYSYLNTEEISFIREIIGL